MQDYLRSHLLSATTDPLNSFSWTLFFHLQGAELLSEKGMSLALAAGTYSRPDCSPKKNELDGLSSVPNEQQQ